MENNFEHELAGASNWGVEPTLVTFFIPLWAPIGIPHESTITVRLDEIVPWLIGTSMAPVEGLQPQINEEGRRLVSLMVWRPKETITLPTGPMDAAVKVFRIVTGAGGDQSQEAVLDPPVLGETGGTVITAVTALIRREGEDLESALSHAFDCCLAEVGTLVRAYMDQTGATYVRLVSRRNVYPTILYWLRNPFDDKAERMDGLFVAHEGVNLGMGCPVEELTESQVRNVAIRMSRIKQGDPLVASSEQFFRARQAYWADGDYAATVSAAHTAGEALLNSVLLLMEWEKGTPRQLTRAWFEQQGFVRRLRSYYHESLGGSWDPNNRNGTIGRFMALAELRGRVVHAGYWPTEHEAEKALEVMDEVSDFVKGRLVAKVDRYPRTALLLLGEPGLRRLGAWGQVERFVETIAGVEDPWIASYHAWLAAAPK